MPLFYPASHKQSLEKRKSIFLDKGMPLLIEAGFEKSPFSTAHWGKNNIGGYSYDLCRLTKDSQLQMVTTHINKGDKWIQISLNIFKLDDSITSLQQLQGIDGLQYHLPPSNLSRMRLHVDDFKGVPLLNHDFIFSNHKLRRYFTKAGFERSVQRLSHRIETDLADFEKYVGRWHKMHTPLATTNEGRIKYLDKMTIAERLSTTGLTKQFEEAKLKYKEHAANILTWLEVDEAEIKKNLRN